MPPNLPRPQSSCKQAGCAKYYQKIGELIFNTTPIQFFSPKKSQAISTLILNSPTDISFIHNFIINVFTQFQQAISATEFTNLSTKNYQKFLQTFWDIISIAILKLPDSSLQKKFIQDLVDGTLIKIINLISQHKNQNQNSDKESYNNPIDLKSLYSIKFQKIKSFKANLELKKFVKSSSSEQKFLSFKINNPSHSLFFILKVIQCIFLVSAYKNSHHDYFKLKLFPILCCLVIILRKFLLVQHEKEYFDTISLIISLKNNCPTQILNILPSLINNKTLKLFARSKLQPISYQQIQNEMLKIYKIIPQATNVLDIGRKLDRSQLEKLISALNILILALKRRNIPLQVHRECFSQSIQFLNIWAVNGASFDYRTIKIIFYLKQLQRIYLKRKDLQINNVHFFLLTSIDHMMMGARFTHLYSDLIFQQSRIYEIVPILKVIDRCFGSSYYSRIKSVRRSSSFHSSSSSSGFENVHKRFTDQIQKFQNINPDVKENLYHQKIKYEYDRKIQQLFCKAFQKNRSASCKNICNKKFLKSIFPITTLYQQRI